MAVNAVSVVRHVMDEYKRFLRTSYRFIDEHLKEQFEEHLSQMEVVIWGPYVTLARDFATARSLNPKQYHLYSRYYRCEQITKIPIFKTK